MKVKSDARYAIERTVCRDARADSAPNSQVMYLAVWTDCLLDKKCVPLQRAPLHSGSKRPHSTAYKVTGYIQRCGDSIRFYTLLKYWSSVQ